MTLFSFFLLTLLFHTPSDFNKTTAEIRAASQETDSCSYNLVNNEGTVFGELTISNNTSHLFLSYNLQSNDTAITGVEAEFLSTSDISSKSNINEVQKFIQKVPLQNINDQRYLEVIARATIIQTGEGSSAMKSLKSSASDNLGFNNIIVYELDRCFNNDVRSYQVRRGSRW